MTRRVPFLLLAVTLTAGAYMRFEQLGSRALFGDELDHYYAAQSMVEGRGPQLPSGVAYERGRTYTAMVALLLPRVEDPELAARLPSAVFGVAGLLALAVVAWKLGGAWAAVWSVLLLTVYPEAIIQSRQARFYTYQQFWAILALYAAWRCVRPTEIPLEEREPIFKTWFWGMLAVVALTLALSVQLTTLSVVLAWGVALAVAAAWDLIRFGGLAVRRSAVVGLAALGAIIAMATVGVELARGMPLLDRASYVAAWAGGQPGSSLAYYWALEASFPALVTLMPVIFVLVAIRRSLLFALFLALWFAIPFGLHSFVLPWKGERYVFAALPALFVAAGIATAFLFGGLRNALVGWLDRARPSPRVRFVRWTPTAVIAVVGLFAIMATPAARDAFEGDRSRDFRWPIARGLIDELPGGHALPIGSSMGLPALFYLGRVDFVVGADFLERSFDPEQAAPPRPAGQARDARQEGNRDWYSGAPVLTTPQAIARHVGTQRTVVIAIDRSRWLFGNIDETLRSALSQQATDLCYGRCGDLMLYLWTTGSTHQREARGPKVPRL